MNILTLDVENTMYKHQVRNEEGFYNPKDRIGSAFCLPQKLVMVGLKWMNQPAECIPWTGNPNINWVLEKADVVVGANLKHDIHWLRRVGVDVSKIKRVHDVLLGEWMLNKQSILGKNSLNDACERHTLSLKIDVIEKEYWSKGIDTDEIPVDVLANYLEGDLDRPERIFKNQMFMFKGIKL